MSKLLFLPSVEILRYVRYIPILPITDQVVRSVLEVMG